jgi:coatomer subunit beta'
VNITSYSLSLTVIQYQTVVLRGDLEEASGLLESIPKTQMGRIARFLESQNLKELALQVTNDNEQKFDLAVQLNKLDMASEIAETLNSVSKWRALADEATAQWKFKLAEKCLLNAKDINGLLLFYTSSGNKQGLRTVADQARKFFFFYQGKLAYFIDEAF